MESREVVSLLQLILQKVDGLANGQAALEKRQSALEQGQAVLEKRQSALEQGQLALEMRQSALEQRQIALESEVRDGFKQIDYRLCELDKDVHLGYELTGKKFIEIKQWQDDVDLRHLNNERWKKGVEQELSRQLGARA